MIIKYALLSGKEGFTLPDPENSVHIPAISDTIPDLNGHPVLSYPGTLLIIHFRSHISPKIRRFYISFSLILLFQVRFCVSCISLDRLVHKSYRIELAGESMRRKRQTISEEKNVN